MGRKVHPIGMRLGINQPWQGRWFAEGKTYREQLHQDFAIRNHADGWNLQGRGGRERPRQRAAQGTAGDGAEWQGGHLPGRY